jgi:deazaflavin-dependent oxidoreductase (nitroreductase family)
MAQSKLSLHERLANRMRFVNKYFLNHITLFIARRGIGPFSVLVHEGRRSGRKYETPVIATYREDDILIPLPYGEHVDWLRNVMAHHGCELRRKQRKIQAVEPELIDLESASPALPAILVGIYRRLEVFRFLRLKYRGNDHG